MDSGRKGTFFLWCLMGWCLAGSRRWDQSRMLNNWVVTAWKRDANPLRMRGRRKMRIKVKAYCPVLILASVMNSNHVVVHNVHVGLISHSSAMLRSMLAMRDAQLDWLTTAAAACGFAFGFCCWVHSWPMLHSFSKWFPQAIWCLHQWNVQPLCDFAWGSPFLGGVFLHFSSCFCWRLSAVFFLFFFFPFSELACPHHSSYHQVSCQLPSWGWEQE